MPRLSRELIFARHLSFEAWPDVGQERPTTSNYIFGAACPKEGMACCVAHLAGTKRILVSEIHFKVFFLGVGVLSTGLCLFLRGPSRIQPPEVIAGALRFIGRHTLEIYAIQLAGSELLVKLVPDLAP